MGSYVHRIAGGPTVPEAIRSTTMADLLGDVPGDMLESGCFKTVGEERVTIAEYQWIACL